MNQPDGRQVLLSKCKQIAELSVEIGPMLAWIRTNSFNWTQRQMAAELGITSVWLCNVETGRAVPSPELIQRIGSVMEKHL